MFVNPTANSGTVMFVSDIRALPMNLLLGVLLGIIAAQHWGVFA